jgi:hypothetical protein
MTSFATRRGAAPKSAAQWGKSPDTASCGRYFLGVGNMSLALLSDTELDAVTGGTGFFVFLRQTNNQVNVGGVQISALNWGTTSQSQTQSNTGTNSVTV